MQKVVVIENGLFNSLKPSSKQLERDTKLSPIIPKREHERTRLGHALERIESGSSAFVVLNDPAEAFMAHDVFIFRQQLIGFGPIASQRTIFQALMRTDAAEIG
ncbi:MAG: hypothetical protein NXI22_18745 [bacterium]|nr:hypothetical protein [bacterium]